MARAVERILGPRVPREEWERERARFVLPSALLASAALALLLSIFLPYWRVRLFAPQYPGGLGLVAYVNRITGNVEEINILNHYIGMRPIQEAARLELSLSIWIILAISLLALAAVFVHKRTALLLCLPGLLFPLFFLVDLYYWLRKFGTELDPSAPLRLPPFVPRILGEGHIGQFRTLATPGPGLVLAALASVLVAVGLYYHRRAYKGLVERYLGRGETG
jgi:copper chaperone NosL